MLSSVATRRSLVQRCLASSFAMGHVRKNVTATTTLLASNHAVVSSLSSVLNRSFSSNGGSYQGGPIGPLRSQPQYAIFGEKTMMCIKMIPPVFRCLKNGSLVLDQNKKGRILVEWSKRVEGGGFDRDAQIRFGLSPEEVGFLLHQLPDNEVEFIRRLPAEQPGTSAADMPEKILRITPGEGGQFSFKIDYEKDSVGGQTVGGTAEPLGPLEVVAQLGEYVVIRKLMELSLPSLIGWDVQTNFAIQNAMNVALQGGGSGSYPTTRSRPVAQQQASAAPHEDIAADL